MVAVTRGESGADGGDDVRHDVRDECVGVVGGVWEQRK